MHWRDVPIHVIDFEGNRRSGILEYGVATVQGGAVTSTRTRLCCPSGRVDDADVAIHRITPSAAGRFPPFVDEWDYFCGLRRTGPLAAHFAGVENHLIKAVWPYPPPSPDFAWPDKRVNEWGPWIDTGRLCADCVPEAGSTKLESLVAAFHLQDKLDQAAARHCPADRRGYHAALYDALAAAFILLHLLEQPRFSGATIPWLLENSCGSGAAADRERLSQRELF